MEWTSAAQLRRASGGVGASATPRAPTTRPADLHEVLVTADDAKDEKASLLGGVQRSSDTPGATAEQLPQPMRPQPAASGQPPWTASIRPPGAAAGGGAVRPGFSPFELAGTHTGPARGLAGPAGAPVAGGGAAGAGRGTPPRTQAQAERQPSTLLAAVTAAGDLHTLRPPGAGSGEAAGGAPAADADGVDRGGAWAGGGPGASAAGPRGDISDTDGSGVLAEYLREEQIRRAAETRSLWLSGAGAKRLAMVAVTVGFLAAAVVLSKNSWGLEERGGLPRWRWFLIVGCLPTMWYLPWYTVFCVVLLLEGLLASRPVTWGSSFAGHARSAGGSFVGGGVRPGAEGEDAAAAGGGPALVIYHILGVRRHVVRVLRSICGQVLVHFAIVDYLDPTAKPLESTVMKAWTCVTLFLGANCLKALIAKTLSKHFHSRGYLQRMQQAVQQELILIALSRPAPGRRNSDALTHLGLADLRAMRLHLSTLFGSSGTWGHKSSGGGGGNAAAGGIRGGKPAGGGATAAAAGGAGMHTPFAAAGADNAGLRFNQSVPAIATGAAATPPPQTSRLSGERFMRSSGDVQGLAAPHASPLGGRKPSDASVRRAGEGLVHRKPSDASVRRGGDGSVRGGTAHTRAGSGAVAAASPGGGALAAPGGGASSFSNAAHPQPRSARFHRWLIERFRASLRKTQLQWDLSRPSNSKYGTAAVPKPLPPGMGPASAPTAAAGGKAGSSNLDVDQLRTSLWWLEQHIRRNKLRMGLTLTDALRTAAEGGEEETELTSKVEAKRLAFYIYMNLLGVSDLQDRKYLVARDFERFFSSAEELRAAVNMFDQDGDGRITLQHMVQTVVRVYKERKKLALTLQDTRTVVAKLELICGVVLHILFGFVYLVIWQVNVRELWLTFSSVTLAFVFIFGNSVKAIYEAVLFLFVVHPFDVGDWILLASGDMVKVEEIALLFCTFCKGDGRRLYYPNTKLASEAIINVSRSGTFWDSAQVLVDLATPGSVLEAVESRLKRFLADQPKQFTGSGGVQAKALANPAKLQLTAYWELTHSGEDSGRTGRWRSKVLLVLAAALEASGAHYTLPALADARLAAANEVAAAMGLAAGNGAAGGLESIRLAEDMAALDLGARLA